MKYFLYVATFLMSTLVLAQPLNRQLFTHDWRFMLADDPQFSSIKYDDSSWRTLNLPHDWAIEGDFSQDNPSGTGGGALPGGVGWYRKTFRLPDTDKGKSVRLDFDGVYMNASVYLNGKLLGTRPYGYISFGYDITSQLKFGKDNVLAVCVDNAEQPNSRWYSGCGIYRNVWLTLQSPIHFAHDGICVTTPMVTDSKATIHVKADVVNPSNASVEVENVLLDAQGEKVCEGNATLTVNHPCLWSTEHPYLYTLVTTLKDSEGRLLDEYRTQTGLRYFSFTPDGFFLNGRHMQIQGVCNHHDLGCLGAAVNKRAIERQLQMLRLMGINGIRCSHNPPAPELLDLCDEMGFIVMDEAFDMWRKRKTTYDYSRYFNQWHERDLHDFVVRDRNHPSVLMWSIGNEVLEQWNDAKADTLSLEEANLILNLGHSSDMLATEGELSVNSLLTRKLAEFVRHIDPTRPITAGCNETSPNNHLFRSGALDIIGFNYHNQDVPDVPQKFPNKSFILSESVSALQTRGYYKMPSDRRFWCPENWDKPYEDPTFSCSSYDNMHALWSNTHEENLRVLKQHPWVVGQYVWTGFDYIGEPTPFGWPARSSYFGIIDLAGFPKDSYYLYQSELTDQDVLHLFPHWNWTPGQDIDLWCYYNHADEVELYVNGVSQGVKHKTDTDMHVWWRVKFEPGEVTCVARRNGRIVRSQTIHTAGEPAQIRLTADRSVISADGSDLSFVTVEVLDKDGNLCPEADNQIYFQAEGCAFIAGVDNGSPFSLERFKDNKRKAFHGKCLVVLQNNGKAGIATLTARGEGLGSQNLTIQSLEH